MRLHISTSKNFGFALVATVSMMVLLTLVAIAMLSLSTIEQRSSGGGANEADRMARANARMALMMALGDCRRRQGRISGLRRRQRFWAIVPILMPVALMRTMARNIGRGFGIPVTTVPQFQIAKTSFVGWYPHPTQTMSMHWEMPDQHPLQVTWLSLKERTRPPPSRFPRSRSLQPRVTSPTTPTGWRIEGVKADLGVERGQFYRCGPQAGGTPLCYTGCGSRGFWWALCQWRYLSY